MKFRFFLILAAAWAFVCASPAVYAQIPVTDAGNLAQAVQQVAAWGQQYKQMQSQISSLQAQYTALTGTRNLGSIFNNPALRDYLPSNWQQVYDAVKNGGYSGLSGTAANIYSNNKIFDGCAAIADQAQNLSCQARAVKPALDQGLAVDAFTAAKSRINQIDQLMNQINATQDPKAIAELQSRIAIEQANINNEQTKMQLYALISQAQTAIDQQRQRELGMKEAAKNTVPVIEPMTFNNP